MNYFLRAQELLDSLMSKDDSIRDEVSKCELAANEGKFRLRDLLTVPMQASSTNQIVRYEA